jgi:hypothetical protein
MTLLDLPALAIEVLRRHTRSRAEAGHPVSWYCGGQRHTAEPRPDKHEGAWIVGQPSWEGYYDLPFVLREIDAADTFDLKE